ncbi:MAG: hypothetical protein JO345_13785 [Streptosporangiaceae bacterium]|nr:hypothetical protein [Streptosporangiaceae bacterium]
MLAGALKQVPARFRRNVIVRVDGAGASHDLVKYMLTLSSPRKILLFTSGWMITAADEAAIAAVPADAWKPGICQDGRAEDDKDVTELTHLLVPRLSTFAPLVCGEPAGPQGLIPAAQASRAASPPAAGLVPSG